MIILLLRTETWAILLLGTETWATLLLGPRITHFCKIVFYSVYLNISYNTLILLEKSISQDNNITVLQSIRQAANEIISKILSVYLNIMQLAFCNDI